MVGPPSAESTAILATRKGIAEPGIGTWDVAAHATPLCEKQWLPRRQEGFMVIGWKLWTLFLWKISTGYPEANIGRYDHAAWWCHRWPMGVWACSCVTVQTEVWGIKNGDMANDPARKRASMTIWGWSTRVILSIWSHESDFVRTHHGINHLNKACFRSSQYRHIMPYLPACCNSMDQTGKPSMCQPWKWCGLSNRWLLENFDEYRHIMRSDGSCHERNLFFPVVFGQTAVPDTRL